MGSFFQVKAWFEALLCMQVARHTSIITALRHCPLPPLQMSDGAAALMLMTRGEATRRRLPVLGVFRRWEGAVYQWLV